MKTKYSEKTIALFKGKQTYNKELEDQKKREQLLENPNDEAIVISERRKILDYIFNKQFSSVKFLLHELKDNTWFWIQYSKELLNISEEFWSKELVEAILEIDGKQFLNIPESYKTKNNFVLAVLSNPELSSVRDIDKYYEMLTDDDCIKIIQKHPLHNLYLFNRTEKVIKKALKINPKNAKWVPREYQYLITDNIVEANIKRDSSGIAYLPKEIYRTDHNIWERAIKYHPDCVINLKYDYCDSHTFDLFEQAVRLKPDTIVYVPRIYNSSAYADIIKLAISLKPDTYFLIEDVLREAIKPDFIQFVVSIDGMLLSRFYEYQQTEEICLTAIEQNPEAVKFVKI